MHRRQFLYYSLHTLLAMANSSMLVSHANSNKQISAKAISLFLCGDVMTGRGIDQILPYPSDPRIYEPYMRNAEHYVALAEEAHGPIPRAIDFAYIWGDALEELNLANPDVRIINLETSVTTSNDYWQGKGINYRMHPKNIPCITAADIDCCVLANNHVLDWGYAGLAETLTTLNKTNVQTAGAGADANEASAPAIMQVKGKGRVLVYSFGTESSGVFPKWAASKHKPGINFLADFSAQTLKKIKQTIQAERRPGDIIVASIHWGSNWGYHINPQHILFAHSLIDSAGVDIIHGHSSHHPRGIEVYKNKPIIYGCGDFLNDYEGISGYEKYRGDLALMYFIRMEPNSGKLIALDLIPMQTRHFKSNRASLKDARWLREILQRECQKFACRIEFTDNKNLRLLW